MIRDGHQLVTMREDAASVEVLDPAAAEQRDAGHRETLPIGITGRDAAP
jgi:hypothetical protein